MTRLEDLQLQRELKEVLLGNTTSARAHSLSHLHPPLPLIKRTRTAEYITTLHHHTHTAALLICRHPYHPPACDTSARSKEFIMVRAIIYLNAEKTQWKIVAESSKAQFGILPALQEFSKDLEREMGRMAEKGGEKRKGRSGLFAEEDFSGEWDGDGEGKRMRF
tara:strand:- start:86 stop:577 length:492 start_codon:yes stop_codon:yes gene_type:complete